MDVTRDWWRGSSLYEIYPRSFADSNGDGIGDLPGIQSRLSYIKQLGVDAIWIAPFFTSPMADFGYDISDYCDVDKVFGTLQDFKNLLHEAHRLGLRVLIDLVLSHTSNQHPWFEASRSGGKDEEDWYVWANAQEDGSAPSNWVSVFGGSAWTWDETRKQYYLHHFLKQQPQLNLHNQKVRAALFDVARFWLAMGVDGFRLDAVDFYFHNPGLTSNPVVAGSRPEKEFAQQTHAYDMMQVEPTLAFMREFRNVLNEYGRDRIAVGEVSSQDGAFARIGLYTGHGLLHAAYSLKLAREAVTPQAIVAAYEEMMSVAPEGCICWCFSNHDARRAVSRHATGSLHQDLQQAKMFAILRQFLPGIDCLYQGEELGLPDAVLAEADKKDPAKSGNRDGSRTPMPWRHDHVHGGFTSAEFPWLPLGKDHLPLAANLQAKMPGSLLRFYRKALAFKGKHSSLRLGRPRISRSGDVLTITRSQSNGEVIAASLNFSGQPAIAPSGITLAPYGFKIHYIAPPSFSGVSQKARTVSLSRVPDYAKHVAASLVLTALNRLPSAP